MCPCFVPINPLGLFESTDIPQAQPRGAKLGEGEEEDVKELSDGEFVDRSVDDGIDSEAERRIAAVFKGRGLEPLMMAGFAGRYAIPAEAFRGLDNLMQAVHMQPLYGKADFSALWWPGLAINHFAYGTRKVEPASAADSLCRINRNVQAKFKELPGPEEVGTNALVARKTSILIKAIDEEMGFDDDGNKPPDLSDEVKEKLKLWPAAHFGVPLFADTPLANELLEDED